MMSGNDFRKYRDLQQKGASPADVYREAVADGIDEIACFRLIREVFGLSLIDAKRVIVAAGERQKSLEAQQEELLPDLERALRNFKDRDEPAR